MRIVIDMQGAQTESRFRGIGRYTMAFALGVVRNRGDHEVLLALSGLFPETIEPIRAAFEGLLPQENIRVWYAPGPIKEEQMGNDPRRETAELLREAFIASLQPDVVHITSLFEGYVDDAVTSIGRFDQNTLVSVALYDLIPLLNPGKYLDLNPRYANYYHRKIESLNKASVLLAISDYAKKEALEALSHAQERIVTVSTAIDDYFTHRDISVPEREALYNKFSIARRFVLYTGGADERKNLPRLIQAYAALGNELREKYQLVLAGKMPEGDIARFKKVAADSDLRPQELIFTGYISDDELVALYNLCQLYVFPSWHEGFGLPALEAMACGAPVIGANTTSLPEVIGLPAALFDPFDVAAIIKKMHLALTDKIFQQQLRDNAKQQVKKFSWDKTARQAIETWQNQIKSFPAIEASSSQYDRLLAAMACHVGNAADDTLVSAAACLAKNQSTGIERQLLVDISELCQHDAATGVQRVVRSYLLHLLQSPPHGFQVRPVYATQSEGYRYANHYTKQMLDQEQTGIQDAPIRWQRGDLFFGLDMQHHVQLAHKDTFARLRQDGVIVKFLVYDLLPIQLANFFKDSNAKELHEQWLSMIAMQNEAICISKATASAYDGWILKESIQTNSSFCTTWVHMGADIEGSNPSGGLPENSATTLQLIKSRPTFLAVSTLEPRKAQDQILDAVEHLWALGEDVNLVLVGQQGWKVDALIERITAHSENGKRLFWLKGISDEYLEQVYKASTCLVAASFNEGFGLPLIEAASHGIPIIARDIAVFREVAGEFAFYFSAESTEGLSNAMSEWLQLYRQGSAPSSKGMPWSTWQQSTEQLKEALIEHNYPRQQLLVDISELVQHDAQSGIQRVVRAILQNWLINPPAGFQVQPVYATADQAGYRYARRFMAQFVGLPEQRLTDELVDAAQGDIFIGLDLQPVVIPTQREYLLEWRRRGIHVSFVVYDLLPVTLPEYFPPEGQHLHSQWLNVVAEFDSVVCISKAVAEEFRQWLDIQSTVKRLRPLSIEHFHLGADLSASAPTAGIADDASQLLTAMQGSPSFLMVGTIEPRKGHTQVLDAFEQLWATGHAVNLVIVGKQGWMVEQLVERLRQHPESNLRLFWLEGISDEYLEKVYAAASCLIAASYGEGFGLPLIEAAQHKTPIIARDIPVFREVAGEYAFYFNGKEAVALAGTIQEWLDLYNNNKHPCSVGMPWLTWKESALQLLKAVLPVNDFNKVN